MGDKTKLNVAVIGVGNMGKHHARVYSEINSVNLAAVADTNKNIGLKIAEKFGCKFYPDYNELITKEKIDALSVAVPTSQHRDVAMVCLDKQIPVLIEKPIAESLESAEEIKKLSEAKKVPVCIGHIERFNPVIQELKKMINADKFGRIISINTKRVGLFPPQIKDADVITDLAVHDIDICNYLLETEPNIINARAGKALNSHRFDYASIFLGFNGVDVVIQVNWITPVKVRELTLTGTKGYAELNFLNQTLKIYKSNYQKTFDSYGDYIIKFGVPHTEELNLCGQEPLKIEIERFLDHIKNGNDNIASAQDGINALNVALAAVKVAEKLNTSI